MTWMSLPSVSVLHLETASPRVRLGLRLDGDGRFIPSDSTNNASAWCKNEGMADSDKIHMRGIILSRGNMIIHTPFAGVLNWCNSQMSA